MNNYYDQIVMNGAIQTYRFLPNEYKKKSHIVYFCYKYGIPSVFSTRFGKIVKGKWKYDVHFLIDCIMAHYLGGGMELTTFCLKNLFREHQVWALTSINKMLANYPTEFDLVNVLDDDRNNIFKYLRLFDFYSDYDGIKIKELQENYDIIIDYIRRHGLYMKRIVMYNENFQFLVRLYYHIFFELELYDKQMRRK